MMHHGGKKRVAPVRTKLRAYGSTATPKLITVYIIYGRCTGVVVPTFMRGCSAHHTTGYLSRNRTESEKRRQGERKGRSSPTHAWESIKDHDVLRHVDGAGEVDVTNIPKPLVPTAAHWQHTWTHNFGDNNSAEARVTTPLIVITWILCARGTTAERPTCPFLTSRTSGRRVADKADVPQKQLPQRIRHNKRLRIKTGWIKYYIKG